MDLNTLKTHPYEFLKMIADTESNKAEQGGFRPGEICIFAALPSSQRKTLFGLPRRMVISLEQKPWMDKIQENIVELVLHPESNSVSADGVTFTCMDKRDTDVHIKVDKSEGIVTVDPSVNYTVSFQTVSGQRKTQKKVNRPVSQNYLNLRKSRW